MSILNSSEKIEIGVTTLIGKGSEFKGNIDTQGDVRIEGILEGQITSQGDVYVGENALVKADIFGKRVIIAGQVSGAIEALNGLEITGSGKVYGDVTGSRLIIAEGALYKGKVNMDIISSKKVYEESKHSK